MSESLFAAFEDTCQRYKPGKRVLSKKIWRSETTIYKINPDTIYNLSLQQIMTICEVTNDATLLIAAIKELDFDTEITLPGTKKPRVPIEDLRLFADQHGMCLLKKQSKGIKGGIQDAAKLEQILEATIKDFGEYCAALKQKNGLTPEETKRLNEIAEAAKKSIERGQKALVSAERHVKRYGPCKQCDLFDDGGEG
ncbi:MAG: phage regulatory CII family protein [Acidobacteria bacterium]|nr:phage regulatory CII family protein [Acidobacteriota bacterium]